MFGSKGAAKFGESVSKLVNLTSLIVIFWYEFWLNYRNIYNLISS
jgi:hypothetical protein